MVRGRIRQGPDRGARQRDPRGAYARGNQGQRHHDNQGPLLEGQGLRGRRGRGYPDIGAGNRGLHHGRGQGRVQAVRRGQRERRANPRYVEAEPERNQNQDDQHIEEEEQEIPEIKVPEIEVPEIEIADGNQQQTNIQQISEQLESNMALQFANLSAQISQQIAQSLSEQLDQRLSQITLTNPSQQQLPSLGSTSTSNLVNTTPQGKSMKLKSYDGSQDFHVYETQFQTVARNNQWSEERKRDELLNALTGKAANNVFQIEELRNNPSIQQLLETLRKLYGRKYTIWERLQEFQTIKQDKDQSLQDFAKDVEVKDHVALPQLPSKELNQLMVQAIVKGVQSDSIRRSLAYQACDDLQAALNCALQGATILPEGPATKKIRLADIEEETEESEGSDNQDIVKAVVAAMTATPSSKSKSAHVNMMFPDNQQPSTSKQSNQQQGHQDRRGRGTGRRGRPRGNRGNRGNYSNYNNNNSNNPPSQTCGRTNHPTERCWFRAQQNKHGSYNQNRGNHYGYQVLPLPPYPPNYYNASLSWYNQTQRQNQHYPTIVAGPPQPPSQETTQTQNKPENNQGNHQGNL